MAETITLGGLYADGVQLVEVVALTQSTAVVVDQSSGVQEQVLRRDWAARFTHVVDAGD